MEIYSQNRGMVALTDLGNSQPQLSRTRGTWEPFPERKKHHPPLEGGTTLPKPHGPGNCNSRKISAQRGPKISRAKRALHKEITPLKLPKRLATLPSAAQSPPRDTPWENSPGEFSRGAHTVPPAEEAPKPRGPPRGRTPRERPPDARSSYM